MKFGFVAKHRGIWPVRWICEALGVSRAGFYAWLTRERSKRSRSDHELGAKVRTSFLASDRTYGARRVWHDLLAEGLVCGLHRIERLMQLQGLKARPRRRRLPPDLGERQAGAVAPNVLDRAFQAPAPNRKWIADFTYIWSAEGWLYVAVLLDLFSRRIVGWSMSASMTAELVTDARDGVADLVFSSNVLEHVADQARFIDEAVRVTRPGGLLYLSYTVWSSPWGGHETSPWHLVSGEYAQRRYIRKYGHPPKNVYGETMFKVRVGTILRMVRSRDDVEILSGDKALAAYFEETVTAFPEPKSVSNWIMSELLRELKEGGVSAKDAPFRPKQLAELLQLIKDGTISGKMGKEIFPDIYKEGASPKQYIEKKGLVQISDESALVATIALTPWKMSSGPSKWRTESRPAQSASWPDARSRSATRTASSFGRVIKTRMVQPRLAFSSIPERPSRASSAA